MKKFVSILVGLTVLPLFALAASYDVTLSNTGTQITIGSNTFVISGRESLMDSVTVNDTNISIVTTAGVFFQLTSADRLNFTVSPSAYKTGFECQSSQSVLTVEANQTVSTTITVTPGSACASSDGGGGGGGGGGSATPATPAVPTVSPAVPATPAAPALGQASQVAQAVSPAFNKDLARGARNDDVKRVQQLLATDPEVYPEGLTTGLYGPLTEKAVRKFQLKYGVIKNASEPGNGRVGPKTRAKLAEIYGQGAVAPATPAVPTVTPAVPATPAPAPAADTSAIQLQIQQLLNQVKALQEQLKAIQSAPKPQPFLIGT